MIEAEVLFVGGSRAVVPLRELTPDVTANIPRS